MSDNEPFKPTADELRGLIDAARDFTLVAKEAIKAGNTHNAARAVNAALRFLEDPDKP